MLMPMSIYDSIRLEVSFEGVGRQLRDGERHWLRRWLARLAAAALHEGEANTVSLGLDGSGVPFDKLQAA
jgi:hypothetical protein